MCVCVCVCVEGAGKQIFKPQIPHLKKMKQYNNKHTTQFIDSPFYGIATLFKFLCNRSMPT